MTNLKSSIRIGNMELKNRLVLPPMETVSCGEDGLVGDETLKYYDDITKGGHIGLVIVEHTYVSLEGRVKKGQLSAADDSALEGLSKLASTIQRNGSKAVLQISHAGSNGKKDAPGAASMGPSAVVNPRSQDKIMPKEMTTEEIREVVVQFGQAARRAKEAGFDGVEIHSAHGYFLNQFYSPLTNKRKDEYGRDLMGRIQIHLETIKEVRRQVGEDYPLLLRLGASDYEECGTRKEESGIASREFKKAGVDAIDVTGGMCGFMGPQFKGQGYFAELSETIKGAVDIPVILTGGITEREAADKILMEKKADLIGVGRAILKDYDWARGAMS